MMFYIHYRKEKHMGNFYKKRLAELRKVMQIKDVDAVFITGHANTLYFSGYTGGDSYMLVSHETASIFLDSRNITQAEEECPDFETTEFRGDVYRIIALKMKKIGLKKLGIEDAVLTYSEYGKLVSAFGDEKPEISKISAELNEIRMIKDESEIDKIRKAQAIADEALRLTLPEIKAGKRENEIAAVLEFNMRRLGAEKPSFDTILASGYRGAMAHGLASDKKIEEGDPIVIDFGALYQGYCSDMTRTVFCGRASEKFKNIYNTVLKAQLAAEAFVKAGIIGSEAHKIAADIIAEAGFGKYFGHGLGHSVGIEIHEDPRLSPAYDRPLPAGVTITVEPGIYIPGEGGVRIEDIAVVKENGLDILCSTPKELLELKP